MSEKKLFHEIPKSADFHSVVMTTYSFDFHHFESQVLRPLKSKGITNVNIFADTVMLDQSIGFSTGHLKSLSTSYSINAIPSIGAFHPKITLLAGENDVLLLQGSGNITNGGHGKNHEIFSVFYANVEDQQQLPLIQEAWNYIRTITAKVEGLSAEKLKWISDNCNLIDENPIEKNQYYKIDEEFEAALVYNHQTSIWSQITNLIPKQEVRNIKIFSPFYDEKGTFIKNLGDYFNNSKVEAFIQPDKGIHPYKLSDLNNVAFFSWESTNRAKASTSKYNRKLHSKIIWFDAGDTQYGLFGSPNATMKAFGSDNSPGPNDEFAVLIKVGDKQIFEHLELTGNYSTAQPQQTDAIELIEKEIEAQQQKNQSKIKILGIDQDGKKLTLFIKQNSNYEKVNVLCFNNWGEQLESIPATLYSSKIIIELSNPKNLKGVCFVQIVDHTDTVISNKQIINRIHELWNTNPSSENRRLMKLGSLLESGNSKLFEVINYLNDIQSGQSKRTKTNARGASSESQKENQVSSSISYEEAIRLNKEEQEHKRIFNQHNSIKIWDAIESYSNYLFVAEQEDDMDDEEEADATTSRERKDVESRTKPVILNSEKVLQSRRRAIDKFLNNYLKGVKNAYNNSKHEVGLIDLAMFMIVMKYLIEFTEREVVFKNETEEKFSEVLFPITGNLSELSSFSGAILNLMGEFVNLICSSSLMQTDDEYISTKFSHYKTLVKRTAIFCLSLIKENYKYHEKGSKWADLLAYNILDKFGRLEKGYEKQLEDFLKNCSIKGLESSSLSGYIDHWMETSKDWSSLDGIHYSKSLGICEVIKKIPATGKEKFQKLARPGFEYNESANDFILQDLFDCQTGSLKPSLQKFNKNKLRGAMN